MFELVEMLSQVNTRIFRILSPIVKENNISISELIILWRLNKRGSCKITDLAKAAGLPASTLTGVFDRLESKGYLERVHDSVDRRSIIIEGTPKLKEMIESVVQNADKELIMLFDTLPPGFMEDFTKNLSILHTHLSQKLSEQKVERK
ncbi:MarR family transcriptional regulator [Anaerocolumna sp. AGMB13025]|uniref:MarR family winged helix-turn-helix transcriptional regulator n=1 Tax=Anaerocolumna sp. AGMB13025 TaxID=3039116 RepID=UPI00241EA69F|nr:MarR family transcriptional regulator [Anaerocolumna sp. AGMB13025]WFR56663.1 MarR family transcriptional regulator [Anaerocolumna sp. AGMB13025]